MKNTIVHDEGTASLEAVAKKVKPSGAQIKIGLDVRARLYVAVAQYDPLLPKAARHLRPEQLVRRGGRVAATWTHCARSVGGVRFWVQSLPATDGSGSASLCHCFTQTGLSVQPGEDRSARCDHTVSASFTLPGGQHAGVGGDPGAEQARHVSRQHGQLVCTFGFNTCYQCSVVLMICIVSSPARAADEQVQTADRVMAPQAVIHDTITAEVDLKPNEIGRVSLRVTDEHHKKFESTTVIFTRR